MADYRTNFVRALVVRCKDGAELGTGVVNYPSGTHGVLLDPKDHQLFEVDRQLQSAL